jgi:chromate transporter
LAGTLGGLLTTWVTFAPCFAWIFFGAPYMERLRASRALAAALSAVTAAVVGVILNLAIWFALHVIFGELRVVQVAGLRLDLPVLASIDPAAALLSGAALLAVFRLGLGMLAVLGGASAIGVLLHLAEMA